MNEHRILNRIWYNDIKLRAMLILDKHNMHHDDFIFADDEESIKFARLLIRFNIEYLPKYNELPYELYISTTDCKNFKDIELFDTFERAIIRYKNSKEFYKSKTCRMNKLDVLLDTNV